MNYLTFSNGEPVPYIKNVSGYWSTLMARKCHEVGEPFIKEKYEDFIMELDQ